MRLRELRVEAGLSARELGRHPSKISRIEHGKARPGFWLFDDERVVLETPTAELTITQPREIAVYARVFAELASMAVYGAAARCLITSAMRVLS